MEDADSDIDFEGIVKYMTKAKGKGPSAKIKLPSEVEVRQICHLVGEIFMSQDSYLDLEAPIKICGDIHGQYHDLLRMFEMGGFPPESNYLFLGDYVDRGKQSVETIILLFVYKILYDESFFMLRGNHECAAITRIYGFYDECKRRYNIKIWKHCVDVFNRLPLCAVIDDKIFCVHGGLSPEMQTLDQVKSIGRPLDVPDCGLMCDFLWADPESEINGWADNDRGVSYTFGPDTVEGFLKKFDFDVVVRAHQVVADGFEFFAGRRLIIHGLCSPRRTTAASSTIRAP
ncbi:unnamed protein product [Prorocentrum cordatum]|uniref:Serine/threonine-protein phosphatase n=1 Tax=Prorocentrum cordatum TaxID=2364126 RepID=A0ABN9QL86_9DINO|nr:unnamed protein product [Polarella glacialis]